MIKNEVLAIVAPVLWNNLRNSSSLGDITKYRIPARQSCKTVSKHFELLSLNFIVALYVID